MNIIITGASKGIGYESAKLFSQDPKNKILVISRSEILLNNLSAEAEHNNISFISGDINKLTKEPEKLLNRVNKVFGDINILINNAGYLKPMKFAEMTAKDDDAHLSTNFLAPMRLIRSLLPIISPQGHIVNISSMSGFQGSSKYDGLSVYGAAKGALNLLGESLAGEFGSKGPSINNLCLGAVQTEMLETAFPGYNAPLKASEMAEFILWFAKNGNKFFNGQTLPVSMGNP